MPTYEWADLRLSTDFDLPELPKLTDGVGATFAHAWTVRRSTGHQPLPPPRQWFHHWLQPDGAHWLSFSRHPGGYLLSFPSLADFDVRPDTREIHGYRTSGTPGHTFNHLLLDHVIPLVAGGAHRLALHASVVDIDGLAVAFLGATRHGKSTLAAALGRRGHAVLSDDCALLCRTADGFEVVPTYPGLRLFPESIDSVFGAIGDGLPPVAHYSSKQRIVPAAGDGGFSHRRVRLGALYAIGAPGNVDSESGVRITARTSHESVLEIVGVTFCLDVGNAGMVGEGFELAAEAASLCPVRDLLFPWDLRAIDSVAAAVIDDRRR